MSPFDQFLTPISPDKPCGEDISYDNDFLQLELQVQGKPGTQFSEAIPPDWKIVYASCNTLLQRSRHLRVVVVLCLASMMVNGLGGLADALEFMSKFLSQDWDSMYPSLDPEDKNNPLERMNILSALNNPIATYDDTFGFLQHLAQVPLTDSPRMGKFNYQQLQKDHPLPDAPNDVTVTAAFLDTGRDTLLANQDAIHRSIAALTSAAVVLQQVAGNANAISFDLLLAELNGMAKIMDAHIPPDPSEVGAASSDQQPMNSAGAPPSNGIASREDVVAAIDRICAFYATNEPSSPVPLILQRAKRLVHSEFVDIIKDLTPDSMQAISVITGYTEAPPTA
jgi:type VI secretion system protein ImpA